MKGLTISEITSDKDTYFIKRINPTEKQNMLYLRSAWRNLVKLLYNFKFLKKMPKTKFLVKIQILLIKLIYFITNTTPENEIVADMEVKYDSIQFSISKKLMFLFYK